MTTKFLNSLPESWKTRLVFLYDFTSVIVTFCFAYILRLGSLTPFELSLRVVLGILLIGAVQTTCFYFTGNYRGVWRFSSTPDLIRVLKGVSLGVPVSVLILFLVGGISEIPRSIFIIQWFFLIVAMGGGRFAYRLYKDREIYGIMHADKELDKTLILGAGYAGNLLLKFIVNDINNELDVIGFIDDDLNKKGKIIHGYKVLGTVEEISDVVSRTQATKVIIAIPSATKDQMQRIVEACEDTKLQVRSIPKFSDIITGKIQISKLRRVTAEDLLGRDQVELNKDEMSYMIKDKVVLITGAGGSIGSELALQIGKLSPLKIICFDVSEYNMYELGFKLEALKNNVKIDYIVGDVRDVSKMSSIFKRYRPQVVFHAAAYKHVPMMELNPIESIKVNVIGTQTVAKMSDKYGVDKFVLISTDKAVNPTNVMGTTKRIAEMVCQTIQKTSDTKFETVRFGNVLGSSGSVIPRFQKQIEAGGPITVTHPEIIRYFMSIPEAAQLVVQAAAIGKGGEIFVLDMGDPVKIDDLAKRIITLAGLKLGEDIDIEYTGLRPGEKLYEELLADGEATVPTRHDRVRVAKVRPVADDLFDQINILVQETTTTCIRTKLKMIVPEYDIPEELINSNVIDEDPADRLLS